MTDLRIAGEEPATEELFLDDNDKVFRILPSGERMFILQFETPEIEKSIKLELYMRKYFDRIKQWHSNNGTSRNPPLAWDEKLYKWVWIPRKMRRLNKGNV